MLSKLDESLVHQAPVPFRMASVTDHRFFDRYWFEALDPSGEIALITGLAFYKNMDMCDGFFSVQKNQKQYNLRLSRPLADNLDSSSGPLSVEIIEPFRNIRLRLDSNEHGMMADLEWNARFPAYEEDFHRTISGRRISTESTRYDQVGTWTGWIEVEGERYTVNNWFGVRDHSWGVRPGVGGFEPPSISGRSSLLFCWACFATDDYTCQFQLQEDGEGKRLYFDGQLDYPLDDDRPSVRAVDVTHDISFVPGTRIYDRLNYSLKLDNGDLLDIEAKPLFRAWAYSGTGYDGGFHDRLGLGGARGESMEYDIYDLSHVNDVLLDGKTHFPGHREQPASATVNGAPAIGHMPVMTAGPIARYKLT
ncbi:MAG: hypothetical protein HOC70_08970 [Gammaproteobacteria bacterium]|jgi:hypothetical protein|nr:hypothetical protein [Gammaproteobacteria bacterium]MBT4493365.1 hypothetical protein [Gammaproteobacteria bacterium]MBT7372087.1 hypothetical protein [Gammaproteobacteria bacterium]